MCCGMIIGGADNMEYITIAITLLIPIAAIYAYRLGIADGRAIDKGEPLKPVIQAKPKPKEETEAEKNQRLEAEDVRAFVERGGKP